MASQTHRKNPDHAAAAAPTPPSAADRANSLKRPLAQEPVGLRDIRAPLRAFIISDALALGTGYVVASILATLVNALLFNRSLEALDSETHLTQLACFTLTGLGALIWLGHRGHYHTRLPFWTETQHIVTTTLFCLLIDCFLQSATKQDFSRLWVMGSWLTGGAVMAALRALTRRALRREERWTIRVLMIGSGETAQAARLALESEPSLGYQIVAEIGGFDDLDDHLDDAQGSWARLCSWYRADFVLIALDGTALHDANDTIALLSAEQVPFAICPPLHGLPVLGMDKQYFFNHDVMLLTRSGKLEHPLSCFAKRGFDLVVATLLLVLSSLPFLGVALLVKSDGGPVFYRDRRIGMNGKKFDCLKFRSMVVNAHQTLEDYLASDPKAAEEWRKYQKLRHDPRVTRIGAFIRKTSLDELPQLISVLRGDMSLVGPRPILPEQAGFYARKFAFYRAVRPGITGPWQVGGRNYVTFARRVELESWYVRNWSLWHDIVILCKTFPVLFSGKGAY